MKKGYYESSYQQSKNKKQEKTKVLISKSLTVNCKKPKQTTLNCRTR
jgi:hypothetical protein